MLRMTIWGGCAAASFAVPMVFGIAIAASSSVFIAAPILLFLRDWQKRRRTVRNVPAVEGRTSVGAGS
jgi:SecD/SecF fusion protein